MLIDYRRFVTRHVVLMISQKDYEHYTNEITDITFYYFDIRHFSKRRCNDIIAVGSG